MIEQQVLGIGKMVMMMMNGQGYEDIRCFGQFQYYVMSRWMNQRCCEYVIDVLDSYIQQKQTQMESRSYMFSTAKKRSTLLESKGIEFPREDPKAPRMLIVKKECPAEFDAFMSCVEQNAEKPEVCKPFREVLFECGRPGFFKANTDTSYEY